MSDRERQRKLEELFQIAVTVPGAELPAFFARHCAGDDGLRAELESLLAHDEETRDYLQSPVSTSPVELPTSSDSAEDSTRFLHHSIPERVGRYHVLGKIGAGGMGAVYLAEQQRPVRRRVALKIVRAGTDSGRVLERFEHERQTLAMMDHPGIAMILDVGTTNSQRPFFVMEYVPGEPITRTCDERRFSLNERLALLAKVCDAVQHAHQKGIVHRDIKPSNVIVTTRDGVLEPKVIDFGIACAVGRHRPTSSEGGAALLGTLHYMAPEQAGSDSSDVDTRADVYSLGVLAYELLVGVLPRGATELRRDGHEDLRRALLEQEAPSPSARAAALAPDLAADLARLRGLTRRRWIRALSGDLDAIVARAMAKQRGERYASASELAGDLRRFLALEPVSAGRATWTGTISRYVRRHRVGVVSGVLIAAALFTAIVGSSWGMLEARAKEALALDAMAQARRERGAAEREHRVAERELREADAVRQFLLELITLTDARAALAPNPKTETVLALASEHVGEAYEGDLDGEADMRHALGSAFYSIGESELAQEQLQRALQIREGSLSTTLYDVFATTRLLARVYAECDGRESAELKRRTCRLAIEVIAEEHRELGVELTALVREDLFAGDAQPALQRRREIEAGPTSSGALTSAERLALADVFEWAATELGSRRGLRAGIEFLEAGLRLREFELLPRDLELAETRGLLSELLCDHGEYERAEELARASIVGCEQTLPADHFRVLLARARLGAALAGGGDLEAARRVVEDAHGAIAGPCGATNPVGIVVCSRRIQLLERVGLAEEAEAHRPELQEALARVRNAPARWNDRRAAFGRDHEELAELLDRVVSASADQLTAIGRQALDLRRASLPAQDPLATIAVRVLFDALPEGDDDLLALRRDVYRDVVEVLGPRAHELPELVSASLWGLARTSESEDECEGYLRRGLALLRGTYGHVDRSALFFESRLAQSMWRQGRHDEIEAALVDSWLTCVEELGVSHEVSALSLSTLRDHFDTKGTPGGFSPYLRRHLDGQIEEDVNPARLRTWTWYAVRSNAIAPDVVRLALDAATRGEDLTGRCTWHRAAALHRLGRSRDAVAALAAVEGELGARGHAVHSLLAADAGRLEESREALALAEAALELPTAPPRSDVRPLLAEIRSTLGALEPPRSGE